MSSRDEILAHVRKNQPAAVPLPEVPLFERKMPSPAGTFRASLIRMGGRFLEAPAGISLDTLIAEKFPEAKVICSATPEVTGNRPIDQVGAPTELNDVDIGVVRAGFAVAETGSIWLSEDHFKRNALGFLSQHLIVLLDMSDIVPTLHHAYRDPGFFSAKYCVFMIGPSATADIEGVLIHGAQGVRSLTVIDAPKSAEVGQTPKQSR